LLGRRIIVLASMALLALTLATGATAVHSALAPLTVFTDPTGDSGTAADITTVSVTNDDQGQYLFDVGLATPYTTTGVLSLYLDTDLNPATGDPKSAGADYLMIDDNTSQSAYFLKWDGTKWTDASPSATAKDSVSTDNKHVLLTVNKSEVGNSTGFNFFVEAIEGDGSDGHWDDAPSGTAVWQYKLQTVLHLALVAAHSFAVKAGGTWEIGLIVGRSDTGETLGSEGTLTCSATSGSTKLAVATSAFISGGKGKPTVAVCSFKVPKKLKHKVLHATVTVSYQGQSVKHSFTTTVK
jgi:hypothetical protein